MLCTDQLSYPRIGTGGEHRTRILGFRGPTLATLSYPSKLVNAPCRTHLGEGRLYFRVRGVPALCPVSRLYDDLDN